jgi:hypothetical protein
MNTTGFTQLVLLVWHLFKIRKKKLIL